MAEFPELYGAVADAYFDAKMYSEALEVYQDMAENDEVCFLSSFSFEGAHFLIFFSRRPTVQQFGSRWASATTSSATSSRPRSATKLVRVCAPLGEKSILHLTYLSLLVAEEEPDNLVSKMQLARVYEQMGEPDRALATINESQSAPLS